MFQKPTGLRNFGEKNPMKYAVTSVLIALSAALRPLAAQSSPQYYIIFSARPAALKPLSFGGHAFVSWGSGRKDSLIVAKHTYGFYPKKGSNIINAVVLVEPGRIQKGYKNNSNGKRVRQLIVQVDPKTWQFSVGHAEGWHGSKYNLLYSNCIDFIDYLACEAHLHTPCTTNIFALPRSPVKYVKKLWRKNKKRSVKPYNVRFDAEGLRPDAKILGPD